MSLELIQNRLVWLEIDFQASLVETPRHKGLPHFHGQNGHVGLRLNNWRCLLAA